MPRLIHMGFKNFVEADKIVCVSSPVPSPMKRLLGAAKDKGLVVDMTSGRRTKAVIFTNTKWIVLSSLDTTTIKIRLEEGS